MYVNCYRGLSSLLCKGPQYLHSSPVSEVRVQDEMLYCEMQYAVFLKENILQVQYYLGIMHSTVYQYAHDSNQ